jgi:hypothetical protein
MTELQKVVSSNRVFFGCITIVKMTTIAFLATFSHLWLLKKLRCDFTAVLKRSVIIYFVIQVILPLEIYLLNCTWRVIFLEQYIVFLAVLAFTSFGHFALECSKSLDTICGISLVLFLNIGLPMMLIVLIGFILNSTLTRMMKAVLSYGIYVGASFSPVSTAFFTTEMLDPNTALWGTWMGTQDMLPNIPRIPVLSPWIIYTVVYLSAIFLMLKSTRSATYSE